MPVSPATQVTPVPDKAPRLVEVGENSEKSPVSKEKLDTGDKDGKSTDDQSAPVATSKATIPAVPLAYEVRILYHS